MKSRTRNRHRFLYPAIFIAALLFALVLASGFNGSSTKKVTTEGVNGTYTLVDRDEDKNKIQVFFWYGCPHCLSLVNDFSAERVEEEASQNSYIYEKIPLAVNSTWEMHARLFYALSELEFDTQQHKEIMVSIQNNGYHTIDGVRKMLFEMENKGILRNHKGVRLAAVDVINNMNHSDTDLRIEESNRLARELKIRGVPAVVIDGNKMINMDGRNPFHDAAKLAKQIMGQKD